VAWPVCTERLTLRRARAEDADAVRSYRRSPLVSEWIGTPRREARTVQDALHPSGEGMDGYGYALLADEWRRRAPEPVGALTF
jgi:hypothetical protein